MEGEQVERNDVASERPIPTITHVSKPFWDAAQEDRLVVQKCRACGAVMFLPRSWCIECGARALAWQEVKPTGTIYSITVSRVVMMNYPGWSSALPVGLGIIELDAGPRMYGVVTSGQIPQWKIGDRVRAVFRKCGDVKIPEFVAME